MASIPSASASASASASVAEDRKYDNGEESFPAENPPSANGFDYRVNGKTSGFDYRLQDDRRGGGGGLDEAKESGQHGINHEGDLSDGIEMGYLPPDQRPGIPGELLAQLVDPEIEDDTEAAEALRANANVKVHKMGKVARSLNAQSVRKLGKRLTLRNISGNRRGKPPRIPPGMTVSEANQASIYAVAEEGESVELVDGDSGSIISGVALQPEPEPASKMPAASAAAEATTDAPSLRTPQKPDEPLPSLKQVRIKDEGSTITPTNDLDGSKAKKDNRSSLLDDAKDIPAEVVAATMEAGRKLMGALDPHNMLQLQRWRRKKKDSKKKRKSYVKGKVIDGRHELYTLSIAMMLGVRTSIARTNTIISSTDRKNSLTTQDFMAEEKYEFSPKGSPTTPPHKLSHTFKFKDYAPVAFAYLRRMFGVNEFDFLLSVCGNANFIEFISNAKSGMFFFYSNDGKYMIKTMTNAESKFLRRILPHYFRHCTQNPNTLVAKFLGMYRVKLYHLRRNMKFIVMNSVYYTDKSLQVFYDLKGSDIGREAKPGQDVLKDNDLRAKLPEDAFSFRPELKERLRKQVVADCDFLRRMQIMDYSMLIGIHHIPPKQGDKRVAESGFRIKERQNSGRSKRPGSFSNDPMADAAAAAVAAEEKSEANACDDSALASSQKSDASAPDMKLQKGDSTRRLIKDIRESTYSVSNFDFAGLLEDEDDCSYLEGSDPFKHHTNAKSLARYQSHPKYDDVELKKEQTIEQIYWPFHRFFDINGLRRMKPMDSFHTSPSDDEHKKLSKAWGIPEFEPPLSDRKDGGLMMDTTGMDLPLTWKSPQGDRLYDGKIFYMGIIDILQQYNSRKRIETTYRRLESRQGLEPSCVSPEEYADRFVRFFDEYAGKAVQKKKPPTKSGEEEKTEIELSINSKASDDKDVKIDVSTKANEHPERNPNSSPDGYKREPRRELGEDGKPIPPKGRVVVM